MVPKSSQNPEIAFWGYSPRDLPQRPPRRARPLPADSPWSSLKRSPPTSPMTCSLHTCSLICYSWYIASVPHLHRVFIIDPNSPGKSLWPKPLVHMHTFGLHPLVKVVWIRGEGGFDVFSSGLLNRRTLRQFRTLNNLQQLMLEYLDIPTFMPNIQRNIGHFLPMVQHLSLREPKGSRRQIIYFIGLFQHLDDLRLIYDAADLREELVDDLTLVPPFIPPLRGSLIMSCFTRVGLLEDMIELFEGFRFRYMSLSNVAGTRLVLEACAQTLEDLWLDLSDPRGKDLAPSVGAIADNFKVRSSLRDFDLSRNKSLRRLRFTGTTVRLGDDSYRTAYDLLRHTIVTVTSPTFFDIMIVPWQYDFCGVEPRVDLDKPDFCKTPQAARTEEGPLYLRRLLLYKVRSEGEDDRFLVCVPVWEPMGKCSTQIFVEAVGE